MLSLFRAIVALTFAILGSTAAIVTCAAEQTPSHPTLASADLPPLISAREFFGQDKLGWNYKVSRDGKKLIWIERRGGKPTLHVRQLPKGKVSVIEAAKPIYRAHWSYDSRRVYFYWDDDGDEKYHLMVADTEAPDSPPKDMTPFNGARVWWHQSFPDDPAHLLVKLNKRERSLYDLYRVNIETGALTLMAENPGNVINWVTDNNGRIIARYRRLSDGNWFLEATQEDGGWQKIIAGSFNEYHRAFGYPQDRRSLWAISSVGRDKRAFVRLDLKTGAETVLYGHSKVDVEKAWVDRETFMPIRAWSWPDYLEFHFFDKELASDMALFRSDGPANVWIESSTRDKSLMTVKVITDRTDRAYYLLDRRKKVKTLLAEAPINRHSSKLSTMEPITFKARDGLRIHGYLMRPKGAGSKNLPMVLRVHGGPWNRDKWGYRGMDQFLANRGYAVLRVNYRGSIGYGRRFIELSRRQFARQMHDDLIDGVNWAINQGIADPEKIAIYGHSYGGYSAMVGLTFTPDVFAAGINVVGITDLVRALETFPPYWKQWLHRWRDYVGDPKNPADRADMAARSPINFVDRIKSPLLMAQGAKDVRVVREHSDRIADAMKKAGLHFDYVVFDNEGHAIRRWQNRITLARKIEQFLAKHLGGRTGAD